MSKISPKNRQLTLSDVGRSFLNSFVLLSSSLLLLAISCFAFLFFYHYNVPAIGVQRPVHLQHHTSRNPTSDVDLEFSTSQLTTSQPYNIIVELTLPDTPWNHDIGNFMVEVDLRSTDSQSIVSAARSAIMQYSSPMIDTVSTVLGSGPILLGLREESQTLRVPVFEGYQFENGWLTSPSHAQVTIHAPTLRIYGCTLVFETRMGRLPWFLHTFKLTSFLLFTALFWISSTSFMLLTWATMTFVVLGPPQKAVAGQGRVKKDPGAGAVKVEDGSAPSSPAVSYPRVPAGTRAPSAPTVAPSSVETASFFEFERDDRHRRADSVDTEATTVEGDQYIKVEDPESD
ncbi:Putative uncharacterized protein [Taphrina deformans PYCC 5710]|uniref:Adipose-regulatory protein n=1 Tax=Taphrina deformans (strain PYCC 5710 / ATCC 11124 / CBS 356.35 / IMI 108563 / JCM 9778 / NBRC 8474) TaxID=1097556 RepID=R4X9A9_TAPDE|nr:Putative uncharacterized protein [Taphrina deformans PYCC 5710]|eukprot:CCG82275.1 Putative uncharacterized protein [Taphrina deformans PYCC 5710]